MRQTKHNLIILAFLILGFALPVKSVWGLPSSAFSPSYSNTSEYVIEIGRGMPKPRQEKKNRKKQTAAHRKHVIENIRRSRWERENFEATKKQIQESKPADRANFKYLKDGLIAHEGHSKQPGGHTIERHVGLSNKGLKDRYANDKSLIKRDGTKTPDVSTFRSLREAERFIEQTLKQQHNQKKISDWLNSPSHRPLPLEHVFAESTGKSLHGPSGKVNNVNGVRIVLKRDPNHVNGWKILTAYPQKG